VFLLPLQTTIIKRARIWLCKRMRRYDEPCSGPGALSPFPSSAVSITNTSGYDFRKGQVMERLQSLASVAKIPFLAGLHHQYVRI